jgi:hypothetical protein
MTLTMPSPASTRPQFSLSEAAADRPTGCPDWCELPPEHSHSHGKVAHRAASWELPDRVELCIMQISDTRNDLAATRPCLYFWSTENVPLSSTERAQLAGALRYADNLLRAISRN